MSNQSWAYGFVYAPVSKFRLTEYGWGFFSPEEHEFSIFHSEYFNLPASIKSDGIIARVHLWKPESRSLSIEVCRYVPEDVLPVSVQYSPTGGAFRLQMTEPIHCYTGRSIVRNQFADFDETDNGGFV